MMIDCLLAAYSGNSILSRNQLLQEMGVDFTLHRPVNLAIAYLATYLHKNGFSFAYINSIEDEMEKLKQLILHSNAKCIGFSTTFCSNTEQIAQFVTWVRGLNPNIKIIIGGAYITNYLRNFKSLDNYMLQYALRRIKADFYVNSLYGEEIFIRLVEVIKCGGNINNIPELYYLDGKEYLYTNCNQNDYEILKYSIDWSLFKENLNGYTEVRTAISCPFSCSFCIYPINAGQHKWLPLNEIEINMDAIQLSGKTHTLSFIDDTFNIPTDRFKRILELFIRKKYDFKWFSYIRCQYIDDEIAEMMKESGCIGSFLGIESGSERILKIMNKNASIADYERGINLLSKYDIKTFASFVLGFPGETDESINETLAFIESSKPTFFYAGVWFYDERAPIAKYKEQYGLSGAGQEWSHKTMNADEAFAHSGILRRSVQNSINCDDDINHVMQLSQNVEMFQVKEYLRKLHHIVVHELKNHEKYYRSE